MQNLGIFLQYLKDYRVLPAQLYSSGENPSQNWLLKNLPNLSPFKKAPDVMDEEWRVPSSVTLICTLVLTGLCCSCRRIRYTKTQTGPLRQTVTEQNSLHEHWSQKFLGVLTAFLSQYVLGITWDFLEQKWDKCLNVDRKVCAQFSCSAMKMR